MTTLPSCSASSSWSSESSVWSRSIGSARWLPLVGGVAGGEAGGGGAFVPSRFGPRAGSSVARALAAADRAVVARGQDVDQHHAGRGGQAGDGQRPQRLHARTFVARVRSA